MNKKEASARIKINRLLEESGWMLDDTESGRANVELEPGVDISKVGDDYELISKGYIEEMGSGTFISLKVWCDFYSNKNRPRGCGS